jgi:chaperonin cofactor prefoldin
MWKGLNELLSKKAEIKEKFDDYEPPYKNMGALIIKAYRNMQHSED